MWLVSVSMPLIQKLIFIFITWIKFQSQCSTVYSHFVACSVHYTFRSPWYPRFFYTCIIHMTDASKATAVPLKFYIDHIFVVHVLEQCVLKLKSEREKQSLHFAWKWKKLLGVFVIVVAARWMVRWSCLGEESSPAAIHLVVIFTCFCCFTSALIETHRHFS